MNPFYYTFVYGIWFLATFMVIALSLFMLQHRENLFEQKKSKRVTKRSVTVIIPAFNEGKKIAETIASMKNILHKNIEFIIVNDGSSDNTSTVVRKHIKGLDNFRFIDRKENKGKAASLNEAINIAKGNYICTVDADSIIEPELFEKVLPVFDDPKVGAATVSVQVNRPKSFLDKLIDLEYTIGLSLFLKVYSKMGCLMVTPGPCSIYRKTMLKQINGFDTKNIVEDHEIVFRIVKAGYRIENCMQAKVHTILPDTFKGIYIQRRRWYSGSLMTFFQHKDVMFRPKYGLLGFVLPFNYTLIMLGIVIFLTSIYLNVSKFIEEMSYLQYTGINWSRFFHFDPDILKISTVQIFGYTGIAAAFLFMLFGLYVSRANFKEKKVGIIAYPALYFLYQIFWIGSIIQLIKSRKVSWR